MKTISEYLKESGRTLTDFAVDCGTSAGHMHDIANGRRTPSLRLALIILAESGGQVGVETLAWNKEKVDDAQGG